MNLTKLITKSIYIITIIIAALASSVFAIVALFKNSSGAGAIAESVFFIIGIVAIPYIYLLTIRAFIHIDNYFRKGKFKANARTLIALAVSLIMSIPTYLFASVAFDDNSYNCEKGCVPDVGAFELKYTFGVWFAFAVLLVSFIAISRLKKI